MRPIDAAPDAVLVGGRRIAFRRSGRGRPLVLVHGGWSDSRLWRLQLEDLSDAFDVVAWDAPGCGGSWDPPESFRMPDYGDALAGFLDALALDRPVVVGLSFGGSVALELERRHPGRARSLVLAGAYAGWAGSLPPDVVAERSSAALAEAALRPEEWAVAARRYLPGFFAGSVAPGLIDELLAIMADARPAGIRASVRAMAEADLREGLERIEIPVLLLYGELDERSPLSIARDLRARILTSSLVVIPGVGHVANIEAPTAFNAAVRRFVEGLPVDSL